MDSLTTIIGYILLVVSEILPLMNIPTNGIIHTFVLGFRDAFMNPTRDVTMAESLIKDEPAFAQMINTISSNPQMKTLVDAVICDPVQAQILHSALGNANLKNQIDRLCSNNQLQNIMNGLIQNAEFCNSVSNVLKDPTLMNSTASTMQKEVVAMHASAAGT